MGSTDGHRQSGDTKVLLTITEAAQRLSISRAYLYVLLQRNALPVVRIGRSVRISSSSLMEWASAREGKWSEVES